MSKLGSGLTGNIYKCTYKSVYEEDPNNRDINPMYLFAVKIIEKNKLKSINIKVKRIRKEIELLQQLDSPYIINYINFCENND